jgi:hypothetical protein
MELLEKKETAVLTRRPFDAGGIIPEMRRVLARARARQQDNAPAGLLAKEI